jgi:hypothetical protein
MSYSNRHRHGIILAGRIIVAAACVLVLGTNGWIFKEAGRPPHPVPALQVAAAISLMWMLAGAWGMIGRKNWGRVMVLTILYGGSFGFFVEWLITVTAADETMTGRLNLIFVGLAVYLIASLVLTNSKHVKRLTSRVWE